MIELLTHIKQSSQELQDAQLPIIISDTPAGLTNSKLRIAPHFGLEHGLCKVLFGHLDGFYDELDELHDPEYAFGLDVVPAGFECDEDALFSGKALTCGL